MSKIDSFLLKKAQVLSDWFQYYFGITNFTLARTCITLAFAFWVTVTIEVGDYIGLVMGFIIFPFLFFLCTLQEKKVQHTNTINSYAALFASARIKFVMVTLVCTLLSLVIISKVSNADVMIALLKPNVMMLSTTSSLYFLACTPKPPAKSKLKEFIEKEKFQNLKPVKT